MNQLLEFFPIILFFVAYKFYGIYAATAVAIVATALQVIFTWFKYRQVKTMQWITLLLMLVFGGATLYLQDEQFIKWKLSIVEWLFGFAFIGSQYIGERPFIERMMAEHIELPKLIWRRLNTLWGLFFISVGFINVYVMFHYNTDDWVTFKTFVVPGLMLAFIVLQVIYLYRHIPATEEK